MTFRYFTYPPPLGTSCWQMHENHSLKVLASSNWYSAGDRALQHLTCPLSVCCQQSTLPRCSFLPMPFLTHASFCPGISTVHSASAATLPNHHLEATSSHYLNPARPHALPRGRGTTELGSILAPGYLGCSGQWDMMRPQKGSGSGDVSSGSSVCQLHSKPTGKSRSRAGQPIT